MFRIIQDNNSHWYVIPVGREAEFKILARDPNWQGWPKWVNAIDGPDAICFYEFEER